MDRTKLYAIILAAAITVAILVPVLLLTGPGEEPTHIPLGISILTPTNSTTTSETTQITVNLNVQGTDLDTVWYRLYNETDGAWVTPGNVTWTAAVIRTLGQGGVYTLYAWANDTAGTTLAVNVTFTMIQLVIIEGDTVFPGSWTVGDYQKYILRHGDFSHSSGTYIYVDGILEIYNVTWTSTYLRISANSEVKCTDSTFTGTIYFFQDVVATLDNCTLNTVLTYGNTNVTINDATVSGSLNAWGSSKLTITNSSLSYTYLHESSQTTISYCSGTYISGDDQAIATVRNYTATPGGDLDLEENCTVTMINSTWNDVYYCSEVYDGTFTVDYNVLSGTGMFYDPTLTVLDSNYDHTFTYLYAYSSAQVLINHSSYTTVIFYELSNGTIDLSTFNNIQVLDNTTSAIFNTTIGILRMSTNKTVNLENTTVVQLQKYYTFYQGIISGYNETFVGAESWAFPKVTVGPGTSITFIQYGYETYNQVNLTLRDTPECIEADLYDDTNGSIIRCNIGYFYANDYTLFNVTVINTTIQWGYVNDWANVTLYNCTVTSSISIQNYAFASFIDGCWVADLNLYNFAGNYTSADSTVVNFDDYT